MKIRKINKNNSSGYSGVRELSAGRFAVRLSLNGKRIQVGIFSTFEKAVETKQKVEAEYGTQREMKPRTEAHKKALSESKKADATAVKRWAEMNHSRKGTTLSECHKEKISQSLLGRKQSAATKVLIGNAHRGKVRSLEERQKQSISATGKAKANKGPRNGNWRGGVTEANKAIRYTLRYREWQKAVFERDNFTCLICKERGGRIEADHVKPFAVYPELRFELSNGQTLCKPCHTEKTRRDMEEIRKNKYWSSSGKAAPNGF